MALEMKTFAVRTSGLSVICGVTVVTQVKQIAGVPVATHASPDAVGGLSGRLDAASFADAPGPLADDSACGRLARLLAIMDHEATEVSRMELMRC